LRINEALTTQRKLIERTVMYGYVDPISLQLGFPLGRVHGITTGGVIPSTGADDNPRIEQVRVGLDDTLSFGRNTRH